MTTSVCDDIIQSIYGASDHCAPNVVSVEPVSLENIMDDLKRPEEQVYTKIQICPACVVEMGYTEIDGSMSYVCLKCGMIEEIIGDDNENSNQLTFVSYNTLAQSSVPIKMTGPKSSAYQKRVISSTSEYSNTQRRVTHDQMTKLTCFVESARVPAHIVDAAAENYYQLQKFCVKRGDVRKGIMAWLVYEICQTNGLERTPREISSMFEISQSELSEGSKIVKQARVDGQLEKTDTNYNEKDSMSAKLDRYFAILEIPERYRVFVETVINFVSLKRRKSKHSGMKARCAGTIYMLALAEPSLGITRNTIAAKCNISPATFLRFSSLIIEILNLEESDITRRKLIHIYKKYELTYSVD